MTGQTRIFDDDPLAPAARPASRSRGAARVEPAACADAVHSLAEALPSTLRLGTSSWYFPGWRGLVWAGDHAESTLSRQGLPAYAAHPLLRTVSLDRAFYRPLSAAEYARLAGQVPADFRFVVKAPSLVCDAVVRADDGRGMQANPAFLDATLAISQFVAPALEGLGEKAGALVFQISPLPRAWLGRTALLHEKLRTMLAAVRASLGPAHAAVLAVEVRNPELLTREFAELLRSAGATYCLGLHAKMPPAEDQLPMLRALWPGPLVCRWNLHRRHGAYGYEEAKAQYEPFDRLVDPDPETRAVLAKVAVATAIAGQPAYITINNKAEGSAPLSVVALAQALAERFAAQAPGVTPPAA